MGEIFALTAIATAPPIALVIVGLGIVIVIAIGVILLFRRSNKGKKAANAATPGGAAGWDRQSPGASTPGAWNQAGTGNIDNAWNQPPQQQPSWNAPNAAPNPWDTQGPGQQPAGGWGNSQPAGWGAPNSGQQGSGWGTPGPWQQQADWGNQNQPSQQPSGDIAPTPSTQDPWAQSQAVPPAQEQSPFSWTAPESSAEATQQAQIAYGSESTDQSWGLPAQIPDSWATPPPPQAAVPPTHLDAPVWQSSQEQQNSRSAAIYSEDDSDKTMLRSGTDSQARNLAHEHLQFTAFHPRVIPVGTWNTLLVYAYIESALQSILDDAARFKDELGPIPGEANAPASRPLARRTQITIVPVFQAVTFNPERISFTWIEDWHQAKFRFQADRRCAGATHNGEIIVYAGPLIIASLKISLRFVDQSLPSSVRDSSNKTKVSAYLFKQIFTSYSHADTQVVLACRNTYKALGFDTLIDIDNLRSGQSWNAQLMRMIDASDIFQLFWSANAAQSKAVCQEWQYALQHDKGEGFIRPVYWEKPLVSPPKELSHLHFGYLEIPYESPGFTGQLGVVRVEKGKEPGRIYEVRKDTLSIGRSRERDIFVEDLAVSRLHASIINLGNGNYALRDEGSANGTKVNDQMVPKYQSYPLREGDKIRLGQTVLIFAKR